MIDSRCAQQDDSVIENDAVWIDRIGFYTGFMGTILNAAYEKFILLLPAVKRLVALVTPIGDAGFPWRKYLTDEWAFSPIAVGEENFSWNRSV